MFYTIKLNELKAKNRKLRENNLSHELKDSQLVKQKKTEKKELDFGIYLKIEN